MARYLILPLVLLLALVALLVYVGNEQWVQFSLLSSEPQNLTKNEISISLQAAIIGIATLVVSIIAIWSLITWLWYLPRRVKTGFGRKRGNHGLDALEEALLSSETGNGDRAYKQARRAGELLKRPALTGLVAAKAAEAAGNHEEARAQYTALLDSLKTKAVGLHGLARIAFNTGDYATAIEMAQSANQSPKSGKWALDFLLKSQISLSEWDGALDSLQSAEKRKAMDKDAISRMKCVILAAKAAALESEGKQSLAFETAQKAIGTHTAFAPANALAARLMDQNGQSKKAAHLLEKAWAQNPHPALALSYRDLFSNESEKVCEKKIKALIKTNPNHRESHILAAEQALRNKDGVKALESLGNLLQSEEPTARLCTLASLAEELLGNDVDARAWQIRAVTAPVEADWSDLDPDGPAFNYTQSDWQRLVISYGEDGELIHPRYENHQKRKLVLETDSIPQLNPEQSSNKEEEVTTPNPDTPSELSKRLENLLDNEE